jgi:MarR family transcriptional regulator, organic hydroperoxide resistance regulator
MNPLLAVASTPDPQLGDVLDFMRRLWAVSHVLQAASKRMQAEAGITGPQRLVLRLVGRFPGISAGRLAGLLFVHPSTLTGVLHRLVERRLISRRVDPRDSRRALFGLTPQGREIEGLQRGTVESAVSRALAKVSPQDRQAAERLLDAIRSELDDEGNDRPGSRETD